MRNVYSIEMARNLLYEKSFVEAMHDQFRIVLDRVTGMSGGVKYGFLPRSSDLYTIYALDGCPHSEAAITKVTTRGLQHKVYYVSQDLGMTKGELQAFLSQHTDIDKRHKTWPVVFKEGRFLGGNDSL